MYKYNNIKPDDLNFTNSCLEILCDYPVPNYLDVENEKYIEYTTNNYEHIYSFFNRPRTKDEYIKQVEHYIKIRFYKSFNYIEGIYDKIKIDVSKILDGSFKINNIDFTIIENGYYYNIIINKELFGTVDYDNYLYCDGWFDEFIDNIKMLKSINRRLSTHEQICLSDGGTFYFDDLSNDLTYQDVFYGLLKKYNYNENTDIKEKDYILMILFLFSCHYTFYELQ